MIDVHSPSCNEGRTLGRMQRAKRRTAYCNIAVARATLPPAEWLAEGSRLSCGGVWLLLARADAPSQEGWAIDAELRFEWPLTGRERRVLRYREAACE